MVAVLYVAAIKHVCVNLVLFHSSLGFLCQTPHIIALDRIIPTNHYLLEHRLSPLFSLVHCHHEILWESYPNLK